MSRRIRVALFPCLTILLSIFMNTVSASNLGELQWQHRLIVVFAAPGSTEYTNLVEWIDANRCQLEDRQVLVINIDETKNTELVYQGLQLDTTSVSTLVRQRRSMDAGYEMVLIGKDGGVKARSNSVNDLDAFISQIDGMPMRRQEMKAGKC